MTDQLKEFLTTFDVLAAEVLSDVAQCEMPSEAQKWVTDVSQYIYKMYIVYKYTLLYSYHSLLYCIFILFCFIFFIYLFNFIIIFVSQNRIFNTMFLEVICCGVYMYRVVNKSTFI